MIGRDIPRTCPTCSNLARHRNCTEPVAAGLSEKFEICWPPAGFSAQCPAFRPLHSDAGLDQIPPRPLPATNPTSPDWTRTE